MSLPAWQRGGRILSSVLLCLSLLSCSEPAKKAAPTADSATFEADGTAHITRVVPMPGTISLEAQKWLESLNHLKYRPETLAERRAGLEKWLAIGSAEAKKQFAVNVQEKMIAGVRTDIITPLETPQSNRGRVLINLHGGGFNGDSGSLIEGVPICNLAKIKVVSVYYRLAPENPFPAAVDDVTAVYKQLLKEYQPQNIGIFGTSAGGILTAEATVKFKQLGLPLPGALGLFTMLGDFSNPGDSLNLFTLNGFPGELEAHQTDSTANEYAGKTDLKDAVLSPIYADLRGMPPTLLVTSTRDLLLSGTTIFHRALLRAGNDTQLVVFEALPHAFWYHFELPETQECLQMMAKFFDQKLRR
jgi:epsilon-lactone hydrolase